jgi:hypothetical protein
MKPHTHRTTQSSIFFARARHAVFDFVFSLGRGPKMRARPIRNIGVCLKEV